MVIMAMDKATTTEPTSMRATEITQMVLVMETAPMATFGIATTGAKAGLICSKIKERMAQHGAGTTVCITTTGATTVMKAGDAKSPPTQNGGETLYLTVATKA